jgi:hypothetical protein
MRDGARKGARKGAGFPPGREREVKPHRSNSIFLDIIDNQSFTK